MGVDKPNYNWGAPSCRDLFRHNLGIHSDWLVLGSGVAAPMNHTVDGCEILHQWVDGNIPVRPLHLHCFMVSNSHQQVLPSTVWYHGTMQFMIGRKTRGTMEVGRKIKETCCLVVWNMIFIFPYIGNFIIPTTNQHGLDEFQSNDFGTSTWTQWIQRVVFFFCWVTWNLTWGSTRKSGEKIVPAYQTLPYVAPSLYRLNKNSFVIRWFTLHWIPFLSIFFTSGSNDLDHPETRRNKHQSYPSEDESVHNP